MFVYIILDYVQKYTASNAFENEIPYHWNDLETPLEIAVENLESSDVTLFIHFLPPFR